VPIELESVAFRSQNPQRDAEFWGAVLNRPLQSGGGGILLPGKSGQVGLRFSAGSGHGEEKNRLHLHLSDGQRDQRDTIAVCQKLGGRLLGNGHVPENSYAVMADVVGDEFCVIEDQNSYLAGCGPLGEVTCDGTRRVGLFWSQALGWPLVWDEGEETAVQSPAGGTKIAWNGESVNPQTDRHRQYFVLSIASQELDDEVGRLLALGALGHATSRTGDTVLNDPDGNMFVVRAIPAP
jgi:Glyoxalase-like domain